MSYYKPKDFVITYGTNALVFNVGRETKDSYSISTCYYHHIDTDKITYEAKVVKNWAYPEFKETTKVEGKKYRETLLTGTVKECIDFIETIVKEQGYWTSGSIPFEEIFIEGISSNQSI